MYVDTPQDQDTAVELDLSGDLGVEFPVVCIDLARCQRAAERPRESAAGRGDNVIQCRGMGGRHIG